MFIELFLVYMFLVPRSFVPIRMIMHEETKQTPKFGSSDEAVFLHYNMMLKCGFV